MSFDNFKFTLKDVIQLAVYLITFTIFVISINNKVDAAISAISDIKANSKESSVDDKAAKQQMQNQINANTLQLQLIKQDVEMIKQGYYLEIRK